jgi:cell filamentation protein
MDAGRLDAFERQMVAQRADEGVPSGAFDLGHLRSIHRHLFQDIYDWAGEIRTTELSKRGHQFMFRRYIERGMADVARRIASALPYEGLSLADFAMEAGRVLGDVNFVHPFREGNGRTQLRYLKQLCRAAKRPLDLRHVEPMGWITASRSAHDANYEPMGRAILVALDRGRAADPQ